MDELEELIADPDITEIMVNGPDNIFIERKGVITQVPLTFDSGEDLHGAVPHLYL